MFGTVLAMLGSLSGAAVLDLYEGSGAVGMEALSRGAANVVMVERSRSACAALRRNAELLGAKNLQLRCADALEFATAAAADVARFDIVFLDPPFALDLWAPLAQQLERGGWLAGQAMIYVESPRLGVPAPPRNGLLRREGHAGGGGQQSGIPKPPPQV